MVLMTIDKRGRGTFPEEVRRALGLDAQDINLLILEKTERGTYELVPASLIPKDQLWFHHPDMQTRVAKAESDFREGRFTRTSTPDAAQGFLDDLKQK